MCWVRPWTWLFAAWGALPLARGRQGATSSAFRGFAERIDLEMAGKSYAIFTTVLADCVSLLIIVASAPLLVPKWFVLVACYLGALVVALLLLCCGNKEATYTELHAAEWEAHGAFLASRDAFFDEATSHRAYGCAEREATQVMRARRQRTLKRFGQWYMVQNTQDYMQWSMLLPTVFVFLLASVASEFTTLTPGLVAALFSQMMSASAKLKSLCGSLLKLHGAIDCVKAFADLLNLELAGQQALAHTAQQAAAERAAACADGAPPPLAEVRLIAAAVRGDDLDELVGARFALTLDGSLPLGHVYGLADGAAHGAAHGAGLRHHLLCDVLGGLRSPAAGALLVPAAVHALAPCAEAHHAVSARRTLLDALRYGVDRTAGGTGGADSVPTAAVWALCGLLGMDRSIFCARCAHVPLSQLQPYVSGVDLMLMALVRGVLCTPELLVVHPLGELGARRTALVAAFLHHYAAGWHPKSLLSSPIRLLMRAAPSRQGPHARTVVWMGGPEVITRLPARLAVEGSGRLVVTLGGSSAPRP